MNDECSSIQPYPLTLFSPQNRYRLLLKLKLTTDLNFVMARLNLQILEWITHLIKKPDLEIRQIRSLESIALPSV